MATKENRFLKVLRISVGIILLLASFLVLLSGLIGSEPIQIGSNPHQYYQIVATPPPHFMAYGIAGLVFGILLLVLPAKFGTKD